MNRIKIIYEIIKILASRRQYISRKEIVNLLSDEDIEVSERRVKQYISDIRANFNIELEFERGPEGGVKIDENSRKEIAGVAALVLTDDEMNALNDSFELAEKHTNFHYLKDLNKAKVTLYSKMQLKIQDYEYYVGMKNENEEYTNTLKKVKEYTNNKEWVQMESKFDYFGIKKSLMKLKPIYVIHDPDETFVIMKDESEKVYYQNLKNISSIKGTGEKFKVPNEDKARYINGVTLKIKGEHKMKFRINTERGRSIYQLWNYEFEEISSSHNDAVKEVVFYEEYKVHEFLLRMIEHITLISFPKKLSLKWNTLISKQKYINITDNGLITLSQSSDKKVNNDPKYTYDGLVLKNKFKAKDQTSLQNLEEKITKASIQNNIEEIRRIKWDSESALKDIHKIVFSEIYDWAGEFRDINISKGGTNFEDYVALESENRRLLKEKVRNKNDLISLYLKMNLMHPFREGNGRTLRLWLTIASEQLLGLTMDFSKIKPEEYMAAMETSEWNPRAIYGLLDKTFVKYTEKNYMAIFMRSTDASYAYEHMTEFKIGK